MDALNYFKENNILDSFGRSQNILEIGPGNNSVFNAIDIGKHRLDTVDLIEVHSLGEFHSHFKTNFLKFSPNRNYQIIIDRLCWHETPRNLHESYLFNINKILTNDGIFIGEHSVYHDELDFFEDNLLFDNDLKTLFEQVGESASHAKYIPHSREIEKLFISNNFKIINFHCPPDKKVICNRKDNNIRISDPDLLFFCVQKSS